MTVLGMRRCIVRSRWMGATAGSERLFERENLITYFGKCRAASVGWRAHRLAIVAGGAPLKTSSASSRPRVAYVSSYHFSIGRVLCTTQPMSKDTAPLRPRFSPGLQSQCLLQQAESFYDVHLAGKLSTPRSTHRIQVTSRLCGRIPPSYLCTTMWITSSPRPHCGRHQGHASAPTYLYPTIEPVCQV